MTEICSHRPPATVFPRQFVLAEDAQGLPGRWIRKMAQGWSLWHCPSLSTHAIADERGRAIGWLLGDPIPPADAAGPALKIARGVRSEDFARGLESALRSISGRFVAIVLDESLRRVYPGPAAQLGVVFNAAERRVASSLGLAATVDHADTELIEALDIPNQDRYFPFGLTPDRRVRRLLPNHYLDLDSFEPVRSWPAPHTRFGASTETARVVEGIADKVRQNVEAIAALGPVAVALTAGRDSRMVLAAARRVLPAIECYTYGLPDKKAQLDCRTAGALARRLRLRHEIVHWAEPTAPDLQQWQERTGHCVAGRVWQLVTTHEQLQPGRRLSGMGGEVGRCFFWRKQDLEATRVGPQQIIERLRLPVHRRLCLEADAWLHSLPVNAPPDVLDLLYIEQRLGCWAGPQAYGNANASMAPLCDQLVFESMLALPWHYRFEQKLAVDFISHLWPDLLSLPFNREVGSGVIAKLRHRARRMWRALQSGPG